jgi:hypothetical protein
MTETKNATGEASCGKGRTIARSLEPGQYALKILLKQGPGQERLKKKCSPTQRTGVCILAQQPRLHTTDLPGHLKRQYP